MSRTLAHGVKALLAHQGGWDELLLPALAIVAVLGVVRLLGRRSGRGDEPPAVEDDAPEKGGGACGYCGAPLEPGAERCPACGFRVRR